jgi:curved DNA-binding protein CbpA
MAAQREWFDTDYYSVLGIGPEASAKEITRAYRKLARELHPDKNPGDTAAEERFKAVSAAYDVLGDEPRRAEYDEVRRWPDRADRADSASTPAIWVALATYLVRCSTTAASVALPVLAEGQTSQLV